MNATAVKSGNYPQDVIDTMAMLLSRTLRPAAGLAALAPIQVATRWHCQVPCGIFDDPAMVAGVTEDCATIRKAMEQIVELGAKKDQTATDFNQMVRWVNTKEDHACKIIKQMGEYGLCQRCKLPSDPTSPFANDEEYVQALRSHHSVMTAAMKCKQNVDLAFVDKLDAAVEEMGRMYTAE